MTVKESICDDESDVSDAASVSFVWGIMDEAGLVFIQFWCCWEDVLLDNSWPIYSLFFSS